MSWLFFLQKKMHFACRDILLKPMTFAGPNNYLQVPGFFRRPRMFVKFKFRSWDYTGLLMFTRFADDLGALELGLSEGQINVTIFQPGKKKLQFAAGRHIQSLALLDIQCIWFWNILHQLDSLLSPAQSNFLSKYTYTIYNDNDRRFISWNSVTQCWTLNI